MDNPCPKIRFSIHPVFLSIGYGKGNVGWIVYQSGFGVGCETAHSSRIEVLFVEHRQPLWTEHYPGVIFRNNPGFRSLSVVEWPETSNIDANPSIFKFQKTSAPEHVSTPLVSKHKNHVFFGRRTNEEEDNQFGPGART